MGSSAVPPYDVYIFIGVLLLSLLAYAVVAACIFFRRRRANPDSSNASPLPTSQTYGGNELLTMPAIEGAGRAMHNLSENPKDDSTAAPSCCKSALPFVVFHVPVGLVTMSVLAFVLTCIIMAILGSTAMLDSLLFSPALASKCQVQPCSFSSQGGLDGWVDEACCSYNPASLNFTDVFLRTSDEGGSYIHGWLLANTTKASASQGFISMLYSHGSGGNVASGYRVARYQFLLSLGNIVIFVFDYPGYGRSSGSASADGVSDATLIAAEWFETEFGNGSWVLPAAAVGSATAPVTVSLSPTADLGNVTLLGRSMGGAMATYVGARTNWSSHSLLLQSTFSSVSDLCLSYFPMFGWIWASQAKKRFPQLDNTQNVAPTHSCMYHSHSRNDEWVPFEQSEKIEVAAARKDAACSRYVVVPDALHTQPLTAQERTALAQWAAQIRRPY
jgi:pimeloyl-ACP methyl ester carboxylesterase